MTSPNTVDALELLQRERKSDPELDRLVEEERRKLQLGLQLQTLRENAGITQQQLASSAGTSQSAVARIESGRYERLSLTTLLKLSRGLGFTLDIAFKPIKSSRKRVIPHVATGN